jgi:hypothetical protein
VIVFLLVLLFSGDIKDASVVFEDQKSCEVAGQMALDKATSKYPDLKERLTVECRPIKEYSKLVD